MIANSKFRGSLPTDHFHYIKFGLKRPEINRGNGLPITDTPVDTRNIKRLYHKINCSGLQELRERD